MGLQLFFSAECRLSAKPHFPNSGFDNNTKTIEQPLNITTKDQCRAECYGPGGEGLLVSGESCLGFVLDNGRCVLATSVPRYVSKPGTESYDLVLHCTSSLTPGELVCFLKQVWRPIVGNSGVAIFIHTINIRNTEEAVEGHDTTLGYYTDQGP